MPTIIPKFLLQSEIDFILSYQWGKEWMKGRSGTYERMNLIGVHGFKLPSDLLLTVDRAWSAMDSKLGLFYVGLLRYKKGTSVASHIDAGNFVESLNMIAIVKQADKGGILTIEDKSYALEPRDAIVFHGNREHHSVSTVEQGSRMALQVIVREGKSYD